MTYAKQVVRYRKVRLMPSHTFAERVRQSLRSRQSGLTPRRGRITPFRQSVRVVPNSRGLVTPQFEQEGVRRVRDRVLPESELTLNRSSERVVETVEPSREFINLRERVPEAFTPDISEMSRPEPMGIFKAIQENSRLGEGLFEDARQQVNESFKSTRETPSVDNAIQTSQRDLPTFAEIIKRLFNI